MRVQQIRDGIRIARRTFTPDARSLNVDYPESAQLALSAAMHRKIARASGRTKMEAKRQPRIPRMTTRCGAPGRILENIADDMPGDGGIDRFTVDRSDVIGALRLAYDIGARRR